MYQIGVYNGSAVSGTFDVGLYNFTGGRLYGWATNHSNTGGTQTGTTTIQLVDLRTPR